MNKRSVECLIKSGAFDCIKGTRAQKLAVFEEIVDSESRAGRNNIAGQFSLFGEEDNQEDIFPDKVHEYTKRELLNMEKEVAGIYFSGHPLDEYREDLSQMNYPCIGELLVDSVSSEDDYTSNETQYQDGSEISVVGIISNRRDKLTRSNTNMAFLSIEDFTGSMEVVVFPKILSKYDGILSENSIVMLHGRLDIKEEEETKLILDSAAPYKGKADCFTLILNDNQLTSLDKLKAIVSQHPGGYLLQIECSYGVISANNIYVDASKELQNKICNLFGNNVVKQNKKTT